MGISRARRCHRELKLAKAFGRPNWSVVALKHDELIKHDDLITR